MRKLSHQKTIRSKQNNCKKNWHSEKWPVSLYLDEFFSSPNMRGQSQACHVDEGDTLVYLYKRRDKPKEKGKLDTPTFGSHSSHFFLFKQKVTKIIIILISSLSPT